MAKREVCDECLNTGVGGLEINGDPIPCPACGRKPNERLPKATKPAAKKGKTRRSK